MKYIRPPKKGYVPDLEYLWVPLSKVTVDKSPCVLSALRSYEYPINELIIPVNDSICDALFDPLKSNKRAVKRILIWSHGIAQLLDFIGLRNWVDNCGWKIDFVIDLDPPGICSISKGRVRITFWDIRNWLNLTLGEMADKIPLVNRAAREDWQFKSGVTFDEYDSLHILSYVVGKVRSLCTYNRWGPVRATSAAQSLAVYSKCYPLTNGPCGWKGQREWLPTYGHDEKVYPLVHQDKEILDDERSALFGGVVSCFRPNELFADVDVWDCNSLYGFLGKSRLFPIKYLRPLSIVSDIKRALVDTSITGYARVKVRCDSYPFPVSVGDRNRYVRGNYSTTLSWPELIVAEREGAIEEYYYAVTYAAELLLCKFSGKLLDLKEGYVDLEDRVSLSLVKRVLNGLWGKFGQRNDIWRRLPGQEPMRPWSMWAGIDADTREAILYRALGNDVWERRGTYYPAHASPIISAVMCGYARVFMTDIIRQLDPKTVLYSATDSLHLTPDGSEHLVQLGLTSENEPGKFSRRQQLTDVRYARPGWYISRECSVHSGVPIEATLLENGGLAFQRSEGLRTLLSTPFLTHLRTRDIEITPPVAFRRPRNPPREFADLWEKYRQRKTTDGSPQE